MSQHRQNYYTTPQRRAVTPYFAAVCIGLVIASPWIVYLLMGKP